MKKVVKVVCVFLVLVLILGVVFFIVDYNRVKNQEKPIFCITSPAGMANDGGTMEYFGLGYKVIDFNRISGYDEIKIGTWFMNYEDFNEEIELYEKSLEDGEQEKDNNINNKVTTIDIETAFDFDEDTKKIYTLNQEEIYVIFNIMHNITFKEETCDGLPSYYIKYNSNSEKAFITYGVEIYENEYHITSDKGEAILSSEQMKQFDEILDNHRKIDEKKEEAQKQLNEIEKQISEELNRIENENAN